MSRDYKRENYLRSEIEIAHRNAKAADTLSRYAEASWWEHREQELWEELLKCDETAQNPSEKREEGSDG